MNTLRTDQTEREALAEAIIGRYPSFDPLSANGIADAILAAGFHRTPTPHVVTTVEELEALPVGAIVKSSAGTVACRHSDYFGVVFGDERPFRWDLLALPVMVLAPIPAPVDREALVERIGPKIGLMLSGEFNTEGIIHAVLDAIEGVSRG